MLLLIILLIVIFEACAQYCVKRCETNKLFLLMAFIFYIFVCISLFYSYKYKSMGIVNAIWSGLSIIAITTVGIIFYHEKIKIFDIIGIAMIILGMFMIFIFDH